MMPASKKTSSAPPPNHQAQLPDLVGGTDGVRAGDVLSAPAAGEEEGTRIIFSGAEPEAVGAGTRPMVDSAGRSGASAPRGDGGMPTAGVSTGVDNMAGGDGACSVIRGGTGTGCGAAGEGFWIGAGFSGSIGPAAGGEDGPEASPAGSWKSSTEPDGCACTGVASAITVSSAACATLFKENPRRPIVSHQQSPPPPER